MPAQDAELLRAVFRFASQRPSATQSEQFCWRLRDALAESVREIIDSGGDDDELPGEEDDDEETVVAYLDPASDDATSPLHEFSTWERARLRYGWTQLHDKPSAVRVGDVWTLQWFPQYGGVLQAEQVGLHTLALRVLALDKWEWAHHFLPTDECVDSAVPTSHVVFACGRLPASSLEDFEEKLTAAAAAAAQITGSDRSAAGAAVAKTVGHQRTPQFLVSMARTVLDSVTDYRHGQSSHLPRGGMTDVGLHTGGAARDTCWPLVQAALREALPKTGFLADKVLLALLGRLLEDELPVDGKVSFDAQSVGAFWRNADQCFEMLERIVDRVAGLDADGYDANGMLAKCQRWRGMLDSATAAWSNANADAYRLPVARPSERSAHAELPELAAPAQKPVDEWKGENKDSSADLVTAENGQFVFLVEVPTSAVILLDYLKTLASQETAKTLFGVRCVETFLFRASASLLEPTSDGERSEFDPETLLEMVSWYRARTQRLVQDDDGCEHVQQHSVYVVLSWVAFCLTHQYCCDVFADVAQHRIVLDWRQLEVCVLLERKARQSLLHVAQYIRDWNHQCEGSALFDLSNQAGTLSLARRMGQSLPMYQDMYKEVVDRLHVLGHTHWAAVYERKTQLKIVRQEIASCDTALQEMKQLLAAEEEALRWEWRNQNAYNHRGKKAPKYLSNWQTQVYSEEIYRLSDLKRQKEAHRDQLAFMPEFLASPLPENQEEALQILCLLAPPGLIDVLAELCWQAQRSMCPTSSSIVVTNPTCPSWLEHVEAVIGEVSFAAPAQFFTAFASELEVPESFGPTGIDDVSSQEAYLRSCVWFPSGVGSIILWADDVGQEEQWVNPFLIDASESKSFFTPSLSHSISHEGRGDVPVANVAWAIDYPGDSGPKRGNLTYAQRNAILEDQENDQNDLEFCTLGSVRAYPNQQLRRVFASITADALAWSDETVSTVIKQTLYQVGQVDAVGSVDAMKMAFAWHLDLEDGACVRHFCLALTQLVSKVCLSPRRWDCVPLLSEVASFIYQFDSGAKSSVMLLARMAKRLGQEIRQEWQGDVISDVDRRELRSRECILYGLAVLCLNHRATTIPDSDEVTELCELLVLFHNAKLFATDTSQKTIHRIATRVDRMMANRIVEVVEVFKRLPNAAALLNRLAGIVLPRLPDRLMWRLSWGENSNCISSCFVTFDSVSRTTYSVNLFTGAITSNGDHPTGLPTSIRSLPQYCSLFCDRDFEVTCVKGVYQTTAHNLQSRQYKFRLCVETKELIVEEIASKHVLQLCSRSWCERFTEVFPARLSKMYSQWYWMKRQVVLLRGPLAADTNVFFLIQFSADGSARCYEVARQDRGLPYEELIKRVLEYPVFIAGDASVVHVLSKFEEARYIHVLRQPAPSHKLEIRLPRFGLRFVKEADGRLASASYRGFTLSGQQQLACQMPRFRQYLVLEKKDAVSTSLRILVPSGPVMPCKNQDDRDDAGLVAIQVPSEASAVIASCSFEYHPRLLVFVPETVEARLQLATIYAAAGNRIPWPDLRMTGGEAAVEMLRGCLPPRPFSSTATEYLVSLATKYAYQTPVLTLLVRLLLDKSRQLAFLFSEQPQDFPTVDISDALDEYRKRQGNTSTALRSPARQRLSRTEERQLLGSAAAAELLHAKAYARRRERDHQQSIWDEFVDEDLAGVCGQDLSLLLTSAAPSEMAYVSDPIAPSFPLAPHGSNTMSKRMLGDLKKSWDSFHCHSTKTAFDLRPQELAVRAGELLRSVKEKGCQLRRLLDRALDNSRSSVGDSLASTVSRSLHLTLSDVMRSLLHDDTLLQLAPRFTKSSQQAWRRASVRLLELCVLEDKLERILSDDTGTDVDEELQTKRAWDPSEHPYWLVFEVEGRLQIRHEQFVVAKHLMDHPGSICQLNMGRGKTRVILPMLFLYYSHSLRQKTKTSSQLVRAHFLSPLLSETRELMWRVLTSSVLALPFLELPFNRSFTLTTRDVETIRHVLAEAKRDGAVVMVAPEHRLSLELERVELQGRDDDTEAAEIAHILHDVLDPRQYVDVFDESDALLHHGYHLVYAVGASNALDGGSTRWLTAESLVRVLVSEKSQRVQETLQRFPDAWSIQPEYSERSGGRRHGGLYNGFRLHATSSDAASNERARAALRVALVEDLMEQPPFELEWLRLLGSHGGGVRSALVRLLTESSMDANEAMDRMPPAIFHVKHQVLALRGLLAFNVLESCLQKRYRVEYGHPPIGLRRKAIAIPYQAADLPAERSEFSHPDVGITLTLLAFYHSGLSDAQVRRAFDVLLSLDDSESIRYYSEWYASIELQLRDPDVRASLANLEHISADNAHQFAIVCDVYRFAIEVINFYANFCVFPRDTRQFPHRLSRSAWDLAAGTASVGFSGTNDTHYLLPHGVVQREPDAPAVRGTNGKMIQLLLDATRGYEPLGADHIDKSEGCKVLACWQSLLLLAVGKRCHALIDTGALLAGVSNHDAAQFLVAQPDFPFQGVTYYDTRPQFDAWVVLEKDRNMVQHHKNSSLRESDTFVVFDEARARGSDMKLHPQAVALLTLAPMITKDKLMQGAGRMRLLGKRSQTLWLTSTHDVFKSIATQGGVDLGGKNAATVMAVHPVAVLNWVMDNTQRQCTLGLLEWAQSGVQFFAKNAGPKHELQDDDWTLEGQYAAAQSEKLIADIIKAKIIRHSTVLNGEAREMAENLQHIESRGETFGSQDAVRVTSFDEECEREVQIEEEQHEGRQHAHHDVVPCTEVEWNFGALLHALSVDHLRQGIAGVEVISLEQAALAWFLPLGSGEVAWASTKISATTNFWSTVMVRNDDLAATETEATTSGFVWNSCLRQVHAMAIFADLSILLLSEFEEHAVLKMLQFLKAAAGDTATAFEFNLGKGCFGLVHLPFVADLLERSAFSAPATYVRARNVPLAMGWDQGSVAVAKKLVIPFVAVVACRLLNGDTELFVGSHPVAAESALRGLLGPVRHRESTLQTFVSLRGFTARWKRSSLHTIAQRMDLEVAMQPHGASQAPPQKQKKKKYCAKPRKGPVGV